MNSDRTVIKLISIREANNSYFGSIWNELTCPMFNEISIFSKEIMI